MIKPDTENYIIKIDTVGNTTYIGKAVRSSITSNPVWQIKRITEIGQDTDIEWADGLDTFTKIYDARASYSYS